MRQALYFMATAVLLTITAGVLVGLAATWRAGPDETPIRGASERTVTRFYDAVNAVIATGDATTLAAVTTADFVERDAPLGQAPDRTGLAQYLIALHHSYPTLRLHVADLAITGSHAVARVIVQGHPPETFLDLPLRAVPPSWGGVDVLLLENGLVAEHHPQTSGLGLLQPLPPFPLDLAGDKWKLVTIERSTYAPDTVVYSPAHRGSRLLIGEVGTLTVAIEIGSAATDYQRSVAEAEGVIFQPLEAETVETLGPEKALVLPSGAQVTTSNETAAPVVVLAVALSEPEREISGIPTQSAVSPEGMTTQSLFNGMLSLPAERVLLELGRATLASEAELALAASSGPNILIVEAGTLDLTTTGPGQIRRQSLGPMFGTFFDPGELTLAGGDQAILDPGAAIVCRNTVHDPLALLMLTLIPIPDISDSSAIARPGTVSFFP